MSFLERFVKLQIKHANILLVLILSFVAIMAVFALQLQIDPSFDTLVSSDSDFIVNDRILKSSFEQNDAVVLLLKLDSTSKLKNAVTNMQDERVSLYIQEVKETFSQSSSVVFIGNPIYSEENTHVQIPLGLQVSQETGAFFDVLEEIRSLESQVGSPVGVEVVVTGFPVVLDRVATLLITDNLITVLITLTLIFLVLLWYFRNLTFTLIAVSIPTISLITLAGTMAILDIGVTITLAAVGVLVLGLGADYTIHISTHYRQAMRAHDTHEHALVHTVTDLALPITASFITTFAGFSALILGVSPSSQAQGIALALAIAIIFCVTLLAFPVFITVFKKYVSVKTNATFNAVRNVLGSIAVYQARRPVLVIILTVVMTIVMFAGLTQVSFSTSNSNWIPEQDEVSLSFREINYVYGAPERLQLILISNEGDLRDVQKVRDINRLTSAIEGITYVDGVDSPFKTMPYDTPTIYSLITNNLSQSFNNQYTVTVLPIISSNLGIDDSGNSVVLPEVRKLISQYPVKGTQVRIYGDAVRFEELSQSLQQDTGVTTLIGLALVFFVSSVVYMSVSVGALALGPIIVAIIWAVGLMGYFDVPFTSLSTGIVSLVLGIGVDFSIHLVDSIKKNAKKKSIEDAIREALTGSGSAILLSSITTFAGFMALTFASLLGTQRLGLSLSFSILAVFVVSIMLVPAVMGLILRRKQRKKRK